MAVRSLSPATLVVTAGVAVGVVAGVVFDYSIHATVVWVLVGAGIGSILGSVIDHRQGTTDCGHRSSSGGWFHPAAAAVSFALAALVAATWIFVLGTVRAGYGAAFAAAALSYALAASIVPRR